MAVSYPDMSEFAREELRRFTANRPTALTIGNFDGVHLGHQYLIRYLIGRANALDLSPGVITLYPDPARVLRPDEPMFYLTSLEERLELMRNLGLEVVAPLSFTSELAELTPAAFAQMLHDELNMRLLLMGPDNSFGRSRAGTPEHMAELGRKIGFEVEVLPEPLREDEKTVSATSIRAALAAGEVEQVARQLGRYYSLRGPVVHGEERGRQIGYPTANISITVDRALPAFGVYATWAYVGETRYASVTNIGRRPTFNGHITSVETHIFDFDRDIYDQTLRIELVAFIRPEQRFSGIEEIRAQIERPHDLLALVLRSDHDDRQLRGGINPPQRREDV